MQPQTIAEADVMLGPATRLLWRSPESFHLELGTRAVVVDNLPGEVVRRIASAFPPPDPCPPISAPVRRALASLTSEGFLWPRSNEADDRLAPPDPRLSGQLTALAARHGAKAKEMLNRRGAASVQVTGTSRLVAHVGAVLAAAGVGRVHCAVDGMTRLFHTTVGGVGPNDEGQPLSQACEAALRRAAPTVDTAPFSLERPADLTVLATEAPVPDERMDALQAAGVPYLAAVLGLDSGTIGPLVLPGVSGCLRCADLHRSDRDPAWPALAAQLGLGRRHGPASDVAVATVVAGVLAAQALEFLDGGQPVTIDGTIEFRLPDWRLRRRTWGRHPCCDCSVDDVSADAPPGHDPSASSAAGEPVTSPPLASVARIRGTS
jgi:hypothetical protein